MTNFQDDGRGPLLADRLAERLLFWVPVGGGALLASLVLLLGVVPSWLRSTSLQESLQTTGDLALMLPNARLRLDQERRRGEQVQQQRTNLLNLIGRPGTVATFLTELDRLAAQHQVQIDLYEPLPATAAGAPSGASAAAPQAAPPGSAAGGRQAPPLLQVEGLQRTTLLLSARGRYPALLAFLRSLERLDVLVAQSTLNLALEPSAPVEPAATTASPAAPAAPAAGSPASAAAATPASTEPPRVVLKLTLGLFEPATRP